ncbi:MAG: hypothetical protein V3V90_08355 [Thermodesulfobacteriota bacterium]
MMEWKKAFLYLFLLTALVISLPVQGEAKRFEEWSLPAKGAIVVPCAFLSVPYFVSKMIYAINGSVVAGSINLLSLGFAQDTATTVGCQAVNGDYIIHPEVFIGERNVEFVGRDEPVKGLSLAMEGKE